MKIQFTLFTCGVSLIFSMSIYGATPSGAKLPVGGACNAPYTIKLSKNKICHMMGTRYYNQTKNAKYCFKELEDCVLAGGRLPANSALEEIEAEKEAAKENFENAVNSNDTSTALDAAKKIAESERDKSDLEKFMGTRFGIALALTRLTGEKSIDEFNIANDTIFVEKESSAKGSLMLEVHNFFSFDSPKFGVPARQLGHGPFAAVKLADETDNEIGAYGIGWMMGIRRKESDESMNFGLGYFSNSDVTVFRPGFFDGGSAQGLTESQITKKISADGWLFLISTTW